MTDRQFSGLTPAAVGTDGGPGITTGTSSYFTGPGSITGARFWSDGGSGTYTVAVWQVTTSDAGFGGAGAELHSEAFVGTPVAGWNEIIFAAPIPVTPTTVLYRVGVHHPTDYPVTNGFFTSGGPGASGYTNGNIYAPPDDTNPVGLGQMRQGTFTINAAPSYPRQVGSQANYFVGFIFEPEGATTPFTRDYSTTWNVRSALTRDYATTWNVRASFSRDYATTWRVRNAFSRDYVTNWNVRAAFTRDYATTWGVRSAFTRDYATEWNVQGTGAFTRDYSTTWNVRSAFTRDYATGWNVRSAFSRDYATGWHVRSAFARDYDALWRVRANWTQDYASGWLVRGLFTQDYATSWKVLADTSFVRDYVTAWNVRAAFERDYLTRWRILSDAPAVPLPADVIANLSAANVRANLTAPVIISRL